MRLENLRRTAAGMIDVVRTVNAYADMPAGEIGKDLREKVASTSLRERVVLGGGVLAVVASGGSAAAIAGSLGALGKIVYDRVSAVPQDLPSVDRWNEGVLGAEEELQLDLFGDSDVDRERGEA